MRRKSLFVMIAGLLLAFFMLPISTNAQTLHRYVVEVETAPLTQRYKTEKLINGEIKVEPQGRRKTVQYYEIISKTPLTTEQCYRLIQQGKARLIPNPRRSKYVEYDLWNRRNMTMNGEEGINPWDIDQTEYDLMYEDPDLYDFIAD